MDKEGLGVSIQLPLQGNRNFISALIEQKSSAQVKEIKKNPGEGIVTFQKESFYRTG
jgi:hypothetical protein